MLKVVARASIAIVALLAGCGETVWNNPHPASESGQNILYSAFSERPKHLDPARAYSENEYAFIANIYQPPLQYHYLKRPYELTPDAAAELPQVRYFARDGAPLPESEAGAAAYSEYKIRIRPGILYQPHAAFARDGAGRALWLDLSRADLARRHELGDFGHTGTRELVAADYVHQIKRLAHPRVHAPIYGLMSQYIVGLGSLAEELARAERALPEGGFLDLTAFELEGARVIDRYTYAVRLHGRYPQFAYWLAMPFFAPLPPEAERFYSQPGMAEKNLTLDWYPVGTGPYMLTVNNPNRKMVLERNPHYTGGGYPGEGEAADVEAGLLADAGRPLPFIDKVVFSLEKEQIPYWNKFLQGYYDSSAIGSDTFDQAVQFTGHGGVALSERMQEQGIRLHTSVSPTVFYLGFNMLDPIVGGYTERARRLRQAINIAIDQEEFISIFQNGRGIAAHGPIPPGIFGYRAGEKGLNPHVYEWRDGAARRRPLEDARALLAAAGYPGGRDPATGQALLLNLDTTATGIGAKSRLDWYTRQFEKLGIQLVVRSTDWNRYQDKLRQGAVQLFYLGWLADYPDPENFLFLLHGAQAKARHGGENAANYENPEYDRLFQQMRHMSNGAEREAIIDRMLDILRADAPWVWSYFPVTYTLHHGWLGNVKPHGIAMNVLKYQRIDAGLRESKRVAWNRPVVWPLGALGAALVLALLPAIAVHRRRERRTAVPVGGSGRP
jgi:oligopeptide transport system substrate-binding protein